jgi:multicomponent Na+:H+ antiporter subunit D
MVLALVIPVTGRMRFGSAFLLAVLGAALSTVASVWALVTVIDQGVALHYNLGGWTPPVGIEYVVDHIAAFVAVVVSSVSTLTIIATRRWADREAGDRTGPFYGLVMLLLAGLLGMVVTGDLFNLFVFLEISSLAAYALVFLGGRQGMIAGFRYLMLGSIGGAFYLLGVGFLYFTTGTLNMADTAAILTEDASARSVQAGAVFIFVGLGLKMALVPLHVWLPDAYTFAPSSVNSLIAPVMTKVGAYAMIRMFISVFPDGYLTDQVPIADALLVLGLIGIVYGSVMAIAQHDLRRMLAYSSIGQLGLIAVGIGLATPLGFIAALLHIMNHAVMKSTLFLAVASVRLSTGLSNVSDLTGLGRRMPLTMAAFTLGAISMVGIPPAAGFFSKWWAVQAAVERDQWLVVVVVLGSSLLTAVYLFRVLERVYLHPPKPEHAADHQSAIAGASPDDPTAAEATEATESPADAVLPLVLLAIATVALGVMSSIIVTHVLEPGL